MSKILNKKTFFGGDIVAWGEDDGGIFIKFSDLNGDPIELNEDQAEELALWMLESVKALRDLGN